MALDAGGLRKLLERYFPEFYDQIEGYASAQLRLGIENGIPADRAGFVGVNEWLVEIVIGVVLPRVRGGGAVGKDLSRRFAGFAEEVLISGEHVANEFSVEVVEYLLGEPTIWSEVCSFAGPRLRSELQREAGQLDPGSPRGG